MPGSGRPIEPMTTFWPGVFATCRVVSVMPKPSRIVVPHALCTWSITSALSGSPAEMVLVGGVVSCARSALMSMRHTVGGAQKLVTP